MGRHDRLRRPRLTDLVLMASTTSALSLFNFQPITSTQVSISCILAYNSEISGCTSQDFTNGDGCSSSCIQGLEVVQETLDSICDDVDVSTDSVLGQALLGNLVPLLCPSSQDSGGGGTTTTTVFNSKTSTVAVAQPTTHTRQTTTITTTSSSTLSTLFIQSEPQPTETLGIASSEAQPESATPESATGTPSSTVNPSSTQTAGSSPGPTSNSGRGGGGPFDITTAENNSSPRHTIRWMEALVPVAAIGLLLLR